MKNVGFITSWMTASEIESNPMQTVTNGNVNLNNNVNSNDMSEAHIELKKRIELTSYIITSDTFNEKPEDKRKEFIDELKWLLALDVQLQIA